MTDDKVDASLDDEDEEGGEEQGGAGGGLDAKKIVLFVLLPLFILIGAGAGLYFSGTLDSLLAPKTEEGETKNAGKSKDGDGEGKKTGSIGAAFLPMPDMLVNLSTPDGQPRYLRLRVQLELNSQADADAIQAVMPRVVDQFQTYLRELRVKDLRGSAGMYRLQIELLARVNAAAYPIEVKDVLFQEILIQ